MSATRSAVIEPNDIPAAQGREPVHVGHQVNRDRIVVAEARQVKQLVVDHQSQVGAVGGGESSDAHGVPFVV